MAEQADKRQRAAWAAAKLLNTEDGKVLLDYLRDQTIEKPNMPSQAADGHSLAIMMAHQEGEKNLYRLIESLIKTGEKVK